MARIRWRRFGLEAAIVTALALGAAAAQAALPAAVPPRADEPTPTPAPSGPPIAARVEGPWTLVAVDDLARALGAPWSADGPHLTLRADTGVLVVFDGSPDGWWQAAGARDAEPVASALPVGRVDGRWYLPDDLLGVLGVRVEGGALWLPDGRVRPLELAREVVREGSAELVPLGPGVEGLRLYAASADGPDVVSLLVVDLGLLGLAFPEQQAALDAVLRELKSERALFLVVTALAEAAWQPAIYVVQDGRETLLSAPMTVQVLTGDPDRVAPGEPVAAVAFLPIDLDLRRPLTVRWAGASGSWTLRR